MGRGDRCSNGLLQVALQGIPNIKKVFIREAEQVVPDMRSGQGYTKEKEWMLDTEGVNMLQVYGQAYVFSTCAVIPSWID